MPLNCIRCNSPVDPELSKYRKGMAAKKCDQCLLKETMDLAELLAGMNGSLKYEEETDDTIRVSGRFNIDPNGAVGP